MSPLSNSGNPQAVARCRPSRRRDFHVAIICALPLEYDAVCLLIDEFWDKDGQDYGRIDGDTNTYRNGRIGVHDVVLMLLPHMGKVAGAGAAASLRVSYPGVKAAFLVGICGGVPRAEEVFLGDVIISDTLVQYDFGRQYAQAFMAKEKARALSKELRSLVTYLKTEHGRIDLQGDTSEYLKALQDTAFRKNYRTSYDCPGRDQDKVFVASYRHIHRDSERLCCHGAESFCEEAATTSCAELGCDEEQLMVRCSLKIAQSSQKQYRPPDILLGRVASGDTVMKSGEHRDRIAKQFDVIAFEMEGAGLWDEIPSIVVKGVCDYADSHKNKIWQPYAAATAAAATKAILGRYCRITFDTDEQNVSERDSRYSQASNPEIDSTKPPSNMPYFDATRPLEKAILDFQGILTVEEHRKLLNIRSIPDTDAVLIFTAQLDLQNRDRKGFSIASRLYSILQSTRDFSAAQEKLSLSQPGISVLLWGSVELTILAAFKFVSYYEALSMLFMKLGKLCPCWSEYNSLLPSSSRIQDSLSRFYASIINCCKSVIELIRRPWQGIFFDISWTSLQQDLKPHIDDIGKCNANFREELVLARVQADHREQKLKKKAPNQATYNRGLRRLQYTHTSKRSVELEEWQIEAYEQRARDRRQRLLNSLSTHDFLTPFKQSRRQRYPGTAEWIVETRRFQNWVDGIGSSILWCSGKIGSGKTIITASVIDKLLRDKPGPDVLVTFFFIRFDDQQSLKAETILRSIIKQALDTLGMPEDIEALLEQSLRTMTFGSEDLIKLLETIAGKLKSLYIVIDGLDECDKAERDDLFKTLSLLMGKTKTNVFLAARDSISEEAFGNFPNCKHLTMDCSFAQSDIATYVRGAVEQKLQNGDLHVGDPSLIEDVKKALAKGADGMFLWVSFQLDELCAQHCDDDIRKTIKNLPKDLTETFNRTLRRIESRRNTNVALKSFQWVAVAKRPLTLDELEEVFLVEVGQEHSTVARLPNDIHRISSWCENLIQVDEEQDLVQFAHHTVRQYFIQKPWGAKLGNFEFELDLTDHHIGEICVTYLSFNDFKTTLARRPKSMPWISPTDIAETALKNDRKSKGILSHMKKLRQGSESKLPSVDIIGNLARMRLENPALVTTVEHPFLSYASVHWIFHTRQFYKGAARMWDEWRDLLMNGPDHAQFPWSIRPFNAQSVEIQQWARTTHHVGLLLLINPNYDPSEVSDFAWAEKKKKEELEKWQTIEHAASEGDIKLLQQLLPEFPDERSVMLLLSTFAKVGDLEQVAELLEAGVDVNAADIEFGGRTALQTAAGAGHIELVKMLLDVGANVNAAPARVCGRTALQAASENGFLAIVNLLLSVGADANAAAAEYEGRNALQAAAEGGYFDIVEKLLQAGANVNAAKARSRGLTAIQAAHKGGNSHVIYRVQQAMSNRFEQDQAAKPEPVDPYRGSTAVWNFYAAIHMGDIETVKWALREDTTTFLLNDSVQGQTALQRAIKRRYIDIVRILLQAGADPNTVGVDGHCPLYLALREKGFEIADALLEAGAECGEFLGEYMPELESAVLNGHLHLMEWIIVSQENANLDGAFLLAVENGHFQVAKSLFARGATLKAGISREDAILQAVAANGDLEMLEIVLDVTSGLNLDGALCSAATHGHITIVNTLLNAGADVTPGRALRGAAANGNLIVVERLLEPVDRWLLEILDSFQIYVALKAARRAAEEGAHWEVVFRLEEALRMIEEPERI